MITGRRAFEGDSQASVLASILKDQPPPISERQRGVPRALARVVRKCLEKKPDDSWQSARDLKPTLELIDLEAPPSTGSGSGIPAPAPSRRRWLWPAVAAAAILVVAGVAYEFWPKSQPGGRVTRFQVSLAEGVQIIPANFYVRVSPDGSKLAFTTAGEKAGIWIRDLESVESRLLAGTQGAVSPFWSPDNKSLAFGLANKLMRVDTSGGPPQVLGESMFPVGSGFWTEDGEIVFGPRGLGPLQTVKAAGGVPQPVTALAQGEAFHVLPSLFPDGRHFLYLIGTANTRGFYVGSLDAKPGQQPRVQVAPAQLGATFVRSRNSAGGDLFFVRDGTLMAQPFDPKAQRLTGDPIPIVQQIGSGPNHGHFSVTAGGVLAYRTGAGNKSQLTWLDRAGKVVDTAGDPGQPIFISLSPDEKQAAIFRGDGPTAGDIWLLDLARNIETRLTTGQTAAVSIYGPVWSPDASSLPMRPAMASTSRTPAAPRKQSSSGIWALVSS